MTARPRSGHAQHEAHGEVRDAAAEFAVLAEAVALQRPRAEGGERADQAGPGQAEGALAEGGAHEHAE
jgi:hypothetical protein